MFATSRKDQKFSTERELSFYINYKVNNEPGFELTYRDSANTIHFSFFMILFFPPTQKIIMIPKKISVS